MNDLDTAKIALRSIALATRREAAAESGEAGVWLAVSVMARVGDLGLGDTPKTVALYHAMGEEMDSGPLLRALERAGHRIVLPVVTTKGAPLVFRLWKTGDLLVPGGFGTSVPRADAPEMAPDVLFVPLLAFDKTGYRLGYGGGFYDRTLERLRAEKDVLAVGVAYAKQRVDSVPVGQHDQRLDWIATERGLIRVGDDERAE